MTKTILIVEDDADLRRMFVLTLTLAGYIVRQAADGLEALRLLDPTPPDLVVLDLLLPALSGLVVQQELAAHAHTRHIPIVVVTGSAADLPETRCLLRKPVAPDRLLQVVHECLAAGAPPVSS